MNEVKRRSIILGRGEKKERRRPAGRLRSLIGGPLQFELPGDYFRSVRIFCGAELACASAATPACIRIWALVRLAASVAKLASRMPDSALARLVSWDCARLMA